MRDSIIYTDARRLRMKRHCFDNAFVSLDNGLVSAYKEACGALRRLPVKCNKGACLDKEIGHSEKSADGTTIAVTCVAVSSFTSHFCGWQIHRQDRFHGGLKETSEVARRIQSRVWAADPCQSVKTHFHLQVTVSQGRCGGFDNFAWQR